LFGLAQAWKSAERGKQILSVSVERQGLEPSSSRAHVRGYEDALRVYAITICDEWIRRGYEDHQLQSSWGMAAMPSDYRRPTWISEKFCASHRSNLLRKNPEWYGQFGWRNLLIWNTSGHSLALFQQRESLGFKEQCGMKIVRLSQAWPFPPLAALRGSATGRKASVALI